MALDALNGSAADDPGNVKLKAYKLQLEQFIKMAEAIETQPSGGITTFQQAHEFRADWANATRLGFGWLVLLSDDHGGKYRKLRCINFETQIGNRCSSHAGGLHY